METPQFLGIGRTCIDLLAVTAEFPEYNQKIECDRWEIAGGGQAHTAMIILQKLGGKARIVSRISDDPYGQFVLNNIRQAGVDCQFIQIQKGGQSAISFIMVDKENGNRTIVWSKGQAGLIQKQEVSVAWLDGIGYLYVDNHETVAQIAAAQLARKKDIRVMYDAGNIRAGSEELVRLSDYVIGTERFPCELTGQADLERALIEMKSYGPLIVGATLGERGSILYDGARFIKTPGFSVKAIDTTGAGDVYHAGFLHGLAQGLALEKIALFANAVAAISCTGLGGTAAVQSLKQVYQMLGW